MSALKQGASRFASRILVKKEGKCKYFGVLLLESIKDCGKFGQIVYLKPGYAHYLERKKAVEFATQESLSLESQRLQMLEKKNEEIEEYALKQKTVLENLKELYFIYPANMQGRLHGSITSANIAEQINSITNLNISPSQIKCQHIKNTGLHSAIIDLSYTISQIINFYIASSEIEYKKHLEGLKNQEKEERLKVLKESKETKEQKAKN